MVSSVSAKTVSRVLNREAPVCVKTHEKIETIMAELGCVPSIAAPMIRVDKSESSA